MDNHNARWLKTMVGVGCELSVLKADVFCLLHVVTVRARVRALESAAIVVKTAILKTL